MRASIYLFTVATLVLAALTGGASAENTPPPPPNKRNCQNTVPFDRWIVDFKREAVAGGIREETIREAIGGMTPDPGVIARDRKQGFFSQTFTEFYFKLATKNREQTGRAYLQKYQPDLRACRKGVRRSGSRHHRLLGARERLRRRHGQSSGACARF